jgi:hypothetical protein
MLVTLDLPLRLCTKVIETGCIAGVLAWMIWYC